MNLEVVRRGCYQYRCGHHLTGVVGLGEAEVGANQGWSVVVGFQLRRVGEARLSL